MRSLWISVTSVVLALAAVGCGGVPEDNGPGVDPADQGVIEAPPPAPGSQGGDPHAGAGIDKVTLCHVPPGNPANVRTITVGAPAVAAHLRHGDTLGRCGSGGGGGGGGGCGAVSAPCAGASQCCAGLTCVDDAMNLCNGAGACTCQVLIN